MTTASEKIFSSCDEPTTIDRYVCIDPGGAYYLPSLAETAQESLRICFGPADDGRLSDLADEGWRCIVVQIAPKDTA